MATMASASSSNSNLLSNGINTNKDAQCSYCKATGHYYKSCPKLKKKKGMEDKNGKKPQRPTYPPCHTCAERRTTQQNDAGRARERTYDPRKIVMITKTTMTQRRMKKPRRQIIVLKHPPQARLPPRSPSQKTDFATTPNA